MSGVCCREQACLRQQHSDEEMLLSRLHADCKKLADDATTAHSEHLTHMTALQNTYSHILQEVCYVTVKLICLTNSQHHMIHLGISNTLFK